MNKYQRKSSGNWYDYRRYIHVHEQVLNEHVGFMCTEVYFAIPIATETKIKLVANFELIDGTQIILNKSAKAMKQGNKLFCETVAYKYMAIRNGIKTIRYCSPHTYGASESVYWDQEHHRHEILSNTKEHVIIYSPFREIQNKKSNHKYIIDSKTSYEIKREPWPQISDFLKELTDELIANSN